MAQDKRTAYTAGGELRLSKPIALGGGTGAFTVAGASLPREATRVTTGLQVQAMTKVSFGVGAEALLADRQHEGAVNMHIRIGF